MNRLNKESGNLFNLVVPLGSIILLFVLILYVVTEKNIYSERDYVENGLAAATLSGAVADLNLYGSTGIIKIKDANKAYEDFVKSLKNNLNLDNNLYPIGKSLIISDVKIDSYIIYNVSNNDVEEINITNGVMTTIEHTSEKGKLKSPRGDIINNSSIYSKISFTIGGFMNINYDKASKECLVDITDKEE